MYFLILFYLVVGFIVNLVVQARNNSPAPVDNDTMGIMLIWPLYVAKAVLFMWLWVVKNIGSSLVDALKGLVGRK